MATIEARGYVSKGEARTYANGTYSKFCLGVKQKDKKTGDVTWANLWVTDFTNGTPPADRAYVTVKGYLTVKENEKDGQKRTFLEVKATEVEVAPPRDGSAAGNQGSGGAATSEPDPWDQ